MVISGAGDCRAVLCRGGKAVQLSREHSAEDLEERQRVKQAGGKLREVMGSWRIGDAGLQVTRYASHCLRLLSQNLSLSSFSWIEYVQCNMDITFTDWSTHICQSLPCPFTTPPSFAETKPYSSKTVAAERGGGEVPEAGRAKGERRGLIT